MSEQPKRDTLGGATKGDIQKAVAIGFLGIFGVAIIFMIFLADKTITVLGNIDANVFIGPFIGIIIGIFTWLGFKSGQGK